MIFKGQNADIFICMVLHYTRLLLNQMQGQHNYLLTLCPI